MFLEIIGWIGAIAFGICGLPQAIKSKKQGHSGGISAIFLSLWLIGEVTTLIYVFPKAHFPLIFNYLMNILFVLVIFYYKLFPKCSIMEK